MVNVNSSVAGMRAPVLEFRGKVVGFREEVSMALESLKDGLRERAKVEKARGVLELLLDTFHVVSKVEKLIKELPIVPVDGSMTDIVPSDKDLFVSDTTAEDGMTTRETQSILLERISSEMNRLKFYFSNTKVARKSIRKQSICLGEWCAICRYENFLTLYLSKVCFYALLLQSASIQIVVCILVGDDVLELGTTKFVLEDPNLVQQVMTMFWEQPRPVCSEHSSSNSRIVDEEENMDNIFTDALQNPLTSDRHDFNHNLSPFAFNFPFRPKENREQMHELQIASRKSSSINGSFKVIQSEKMENLMDKNHYKWTLSTILKNSKGLNSSSVFPISSPASSFTTWRRNLSVNKKKNMEVGIKLQTKRKMMWEQAMFCQKGKEEKS